MRVARCVEIASNAPRPSSRVVQLRAVERAVEVAARDQDLTVGQQRRCVVTAGYVEIAGNAPRPSSRVVQLRAVESAVEVAARNQDLTVGQQRRCTTAGSGQIAGDAP